MSNKKYLRKNEIREDLNPAHRNKYGSTHDAVITARLGHKFKANTITHSKYVHGIECLDLEPYSKNKRHKRISPPFMQNAKLFGPKKNKKIPKKDFRMIQKYNKKFYK